MKLGFQHSKVVTSMFIKYEPTWVSILLVIVDEIILTSDTDYLGEITLQLNECFTLKELGDLHFFLGIQITLSDDNLHLNHHTHTHTHIHTHIYY